MSVLTTSAYDKHQLLGVCRVAYETSQIYFNFEEFVMSEVEFKIGDLVYCPHLTTRILKVVASENSPNLVAIESNNKLIDITTDGKVWNKQGLVSDVFPATQENYELLSKLYPNFTFEPPPKRKEPREIIEAMIKAGWKMIPCCDINDYIGNPPFGIHVLSSSTFETVDTERIIGKLIPFDPKTALEIIDFVDGKCVLENGEVVE